MLIGSLEVLLAELKLLKLQGLSTEIVEAKLLLTPLPLSPQAECNISSEQAAAAKE